MNVTGPLGLHEEPGDTPDVVDHRIEVVLSVRPNISIESAHALIATSPRSFAWREELDPVRCPWSWIARAPSVARLGHDAVILEDAVRTERVERPVLQEDVDLTPHGCRAHREHGGGVELVVRAGEQDQRERVISHVGLPCVGSSDLRSHHRERMQGCGGLGGPKREGLLALLVSRCEGQPGRPPGRPAVRRRLDEVEP